MKQLVKISCLFAVAAMAAVSCAKTEQDKTTFTHRVYIDVNEPVKTSIVESGSNASFIWSSDDASRFTIKENDVPGTAITLSSSDGYATMTLAAEFETVSAAEYTYSAFLAVHKTNSGKPRIATIQTSDGSSYDPNADVLIAKPQTFDAIQSSLSMRFMRPVVIAKMTLKGLNGGETVQSVKLTSNTNITGYYDESNDSWTGDGKEITINTNQVVPSSGDNAGNVTVYFISMPVEDATLSVTVTTAETIYSKTFARPITFTLGEEKVFGVSGMASTPNSSLAGYYLVGCYNSDSWKLMNPDVNTSGSNHYYPAFSTSVTTAPATVDFDTDFAGISNINKYIWQVEEYDGEYSIKSLDSGNYLSYSGNANAAQAASSLSTATKFKISIDGSNVATIESCNVEGRKLQYNSTNPRFACYTTAQNSLVLIPATVDDRTAVTLSFAEDALDYDTDNYAGCSGQVASASPNVAAITSAITYAIDGDSIGTVDENTGEVSLNGTAGSATVTATFAGDGDYRSASASYTINVAQAGVNDGSLAHPYTADEAYDIISGYSSGSGSDGSKYVSGIVVSVTGLYNNTMLNYYISSDGSTTKQIQVFRGKFVANTNFSSADQVQVGDEVIVYGQLYKYNNTCEINTGNYIYSLNGKNKVLTAGSLTTSTNDANKQITVTWGAATGTESAISYVVTCGNQNYNASAAGSYTFTMADYDTYAVSVVASASDAVSVTSSTSATLTDPNAGSNPQTYQHIFTAKPSTGNNVALSGVNWNISATQLGSYNSSNYAGVQIGTKSAAGSITLTSSSSWSYNSATRITEVRLWLNAGTDTPTATVTIGGVSAISDGTTVVKNSSASSYSDASCVTFTPGTGGNTGTVVINISTSSKAAYVCAMEIDCE